MPEKQKKISVYMITYNHEKYIAKALDSVLMQQHDHSYEIIVGDDYSTDKTREILLQYKEKHPDVITLIFHPKNIGATLNSLKVLEACKGEYVAMLDGDDYWTDDKKLKKQIGFLEKHPEYVLSSHRYKHYIEKDNAYNTDHEYHGLFEAHPDGVILDHELFFKYWFTMPLTVVFRNNALDFNDVCGYRDFKDLVLFFYLLKKGPGYVQNFVGGVYNTHDHGVWSKLDAYDKWKDNFIVLDQMIKKNKDHKLLKDAHAGCLRHLQNLFLDSYRFPYLKPEAYWLMTKRLLLTIPQ